MVFNQLDADVFLRALHVIHDRLLAARRIKADQHRPILLHIDVVRLARGVEAEGVAAVFIGLGRDVVQGEILLRDPALAVIGRDGEEPALVEVQRRDRERDL